MTRIAVCIGRFQPVHNGHVGLIRQALESADKAIVVIGSAHRAKTPRNPFTWQERVEMLRMAIPSNEYSRVCVLPIRDYFDDERWNAEVCHQVSRAAAQLTGSARPDITVWSARDGDTGAAESGFVEWSQRTADRHNAKRGSVIRNCLFEATYRDANEAQPESHLPSAFDKISSDIPTSVLSWLRTASAESWWKALGNEWHTLQHIKKLWANSPYPPTFVTVDAVVRCNEHVLLIRRGSTPGAGLLALPGGFVEQHELLRNAVLRELAEETSIDVPADELNARRVGQEVFDHPHRSLFGRVVTQGHFFDLGQRPFPAIQAADDARTAHWIAIDQLPELEDQFHDDHFFILDHFLGLL